MPLHKEAQEGMQPFARKLINARALGVTLAFGAFVLLILALRSPAAPGVCVVGDVRALRAALVPATLRHAQLDAAHMQVGVGVAAIEGWEGLGDAVVVAGRVYVRSTRRETRRAQALESGRFFQTSSLVYVPAGVHASETISVQAGTTLDNLWQQLTTRYPDGVLVAGTIQWQQLRRYVITRAPIDGLSIPEHATDYYTQPMQISSDTWTYLVGIAASAHAIPAASTLFARHPDGRLNLPVHLLVLKAEPADHTQAPKREAVLTVGRAAGDSRLASAQLMLYPLQHHDACREAFVSSSVNTSEANSPQ